MTQTSSLIEVPSLLVLAVQIKWSGESDLGRGPWVWYMWFTMSLQIYKYAALSNLTLRKMDIPQPGYLLNIDKTVSQRWRKLYFPEQVHLNRMRPAIERCSDKGCLSLSLLEFLSFNMTFVFIASVLVLIEVLLFTLCRCEPPLGTCRTWMSSSSCGCTETWKLSHHVLSISEHQVRQRSSVLRESQILACNIIVTNHIDMLVYFSLYFLFFF